MNFFAVDFLQFPLSFSVPFESPPSAPLPKGIFQSLHTYSPENPMMEKLQGSPTRC